MHVPGRAVRRDVECECQSCAPAADDWCRPFVDREHQVQGATLLLSKHEMGLSCGLTYSVAPVFWRFCCGSIAEKLPRRRRGGALGAADRYRWALLWQVGGDWAGLRGCATYRPVAAHAG